MSAPMHGLEHELRQHAGALRALALRLVGPAHADDLVQDTSLLAWTQRPDERSGLGSWLRAVLRHRAGKLRRSEGRRRHREGVGGAHEEAPSPLDLAAQREAMTALHDALMLLPAPYQGVLLQRFFQDRTPTAIAAAANVPLATVKSQLQRGLALLRERLDAGGRRDWRGAFAGAFALPRTTAPVVAASAGALLMSTKTLWIGGAAAVALLCVVMWPDTRSTAPPARGASDVAAATAPTSSGAVNAAPERREVTAAPADVAAAAAPMRIRVVDAFDDAPLPDFCVRLERNRAGHTMNRTDMLGVTEIDGAWRDQEVTVIAIDDGRIENPAMPPSHTIAASQWLTDDRCLDVPFAVGPTYRLLFDGVPPEGNLEAELIAGNNVAHAERRDRQPVRAGAPPWVRFPASNTSPSSLGDGPWTLVVFGKDWMAAGPVEQVRGAQATPVMLRACACGSLRVEATIGGEPVRGKHTAAASVYALDKGEPVAAGGRTLDLTRGQSQLSDLPVGPYRVFVTGQDRQGHREDITIEAGVTTVVRAAIPAGAERFTLQVVLKSQTGTRQVGALPDARLVGGKEFVNGTWIRLEDGAAVYELRGLLPGEWDVTIGPTPHLPPWDATTKRVRADNGTVEFLCLDAGARPPGHGRLRVIDGRTKQAIGGAGITTLLDGMNYMDDADANGIGALGPCLAGTAVRVLVRAVGYAPAWLEVTAVESEEPPPHEVALQAGWGTLLMVVRPSATYSGGEALPGVRVLVDGALAGTTDARGFFLLSTTTRPARIELQHDDYVHHYFGIDAATGAPDSQARAPHFIVMAKKGAK